MWIKSLWKIWKFFLEFTFELENNPKKPEVLHFYSTEFLFFVLSLLISVNLISIVRPVPIGWDDLWVYMNYANMMSQAWDILSLWWMYTWQVFTWIGFMTGSNTQAFFFNSIWGMMFILTIFLIFKDIFWKPKQLLLNIPLLLVTVLTAMPMITFQLSKDMKLDPGLLFVSSIALYLIYYVFLKIWTSDLEVGNDTHENTAELEKQKKTYLFLAALLIWFCFSIKFTSLLLLSWVLWVVAFGTLWVGGFLWYVWVYISIFTKLWLWSYMNISYPNENIVFVNVVFILSAMFWWICFYFSWKWSWDWVLFKRFLSYVSLILVWFSIAISPWILKNIWESFPDISISYLLWWKPNTLKLDYTTIYSKEEIQEIQEIAKARSLSASGSIQNEDWGRYFWDEPWINNYLKFPLNLTTQRNQWGEFTDIGFLYLALLPTILLFLPYRRREYVYITWGVCMLWLLAFLFPPTAVFVTSLLWNIVLPFGYIIIFWLFLFWLVLLKIIALEKKHMQLFQYNLIFTLFYVFLWTISSYWVVWYGIVMYMSFLLMIGICIYYISHYKKSDSSEVIQTKIVWSSVVFVIFSFSFFMSSIPQAMNNLKFSWYGQYKLWNISAEESVFWNQNGYLEAIYELNIDTDKRDLFLDDTIENQEIKKLIQKTDDIGIQKITNTLKVIQNDPQITDITLKRESLETLEKIYEKILRPEPEYANKKNILRVGTFLAYYINQSKLRMSVDSLLFNFNDYLYDVSAEKTLENIKSVWLEYLLVDLNAATIDNDERKNLTARYEKMLMFMTHPDIQLISTDSVCLRIARNNIMKVENSQEEREKFKLLAWVNYESFDDSWNEILRNKKLANCYNIINILFQEDNETLLAGWYGFLIPFKNYLEDNMWEISAIWDAEKMEFIAQAFWTWRFALFKITQ
jgi:hypothetical protein